MLLPVRHFSKLSSQLPRHHIASIKIKPAALNRIKTIVNDKKKDLIKMNDMKHPIGISIDVKRRGCNGLSYILDYQYSLTPSNKMDDIIKKDGLTIVVKSKAIFFVAGTEMDWQEDSLSSEFTFKNPNEKGRCGCGESFNI